jgi:hypothetical protein
MVVRPKQPFKNLIDVRMIQAYMADDDLKIKHSEYVHSREFLFMPVHKSPLLIALMPRPWHYRYTDSFASISLLWTFITVITTLLKLPRDKVIEELDILDKNTLENLNEKTFRETMMNYTIQKIQIYERFLWKLLNLNFPVELILTPHMFPNFEQLTKEDQDSYLVKMAHYFETKELLRNIRMEKGSPEGQYKHKIYFPNKGQNLFEYYKFLTDD